jgi:hypothetical protein
VRRPEVQPTPFVQTRLCSCASASLKRDIVINRQPELESDIEAAMAVFWPSV